MAGIASSSGGNLSKYTYVLSPQKPMWSRVSFSNASEQFILPPSPQFLWNNNRLITRTGKPKEGGKMTCFLCHNVPACFRLRGCAWRSLTHIFSTWEVCIAVPTPAVYICLKLLSNNMTVHFTTMQQGAHHPYNICSWASFNSICMHSIQNGFPALAGSPERLII